ncbi:hypothetical protein J8L86_12580 [Shewanella sp. MMG014]|uniref:hypothetical protein n=1 Tax=Shewanella sp. MMG014 TaxID=2822691 RepID=UPI001B3701FD|nr:hypothetical protein [Shewanella sp. MMG014]MBQ4890688.1 hypothetical protein [Shewanella sp. MMG014]
MKKLFFIGLMLMSSNGFAASGWSGAATIESMYLVNEDQIVIKLSSFNNVTGCSFSPDGQVMVRPSSQKVSYSMILSAFMAGKKVNFYLFGECQTTHWADVSFASFGHLKVLH